MTRPDPTILAFDTSAAHCAALLVRRGVLQINRYEEMSRGQAERLFPLLEDYLADSGVAWSDLDAVAVGIGPGNFTGIRIAVAAARGLSMSLGIPAIGVSTFEAVFEPYTVWTIGGPPDVPRPDLFDEIALPAPRGLAYVQTFRNNEPDGAPRLAASDGQDLKTPDWSEQAIYRLASVAIDRFAKGGPFDRPAPLYVRPADAAPPREAPPVILP